MFLPTALLIALLLSLIIFFLTLRCHIYVRSAFALSTLFFLVFLALLYPYPKVGQQVWPTYAYHPRIDLSIILYAFIQLIAIIYLIFYIVVSVFYDRYPVVNS